MTLAMMEHAAGNGPGAHASVVGRAQVVPMVLSAVLIVVLVACGWAGNGGVMPIDLRTRSSRNGRPNTVGAWASRSPRYCWYLSSDSRSTASGLMGRGGLRRWRSLGCLSSSTLVPGSDLAAEGDGVSRAPAEAGRPSQLL